MKKKIKPEFHVFGWFPGLKNMDVFLGKFTAELVLKSFLGRYNSLEVPLFEFFNSLPFGLEKSRELRALFS